MFISFMTVAASAVIIDNILLGSSLAVGVYSVAKTGKGTLPKRK